MLRRFIAVFVAVVLSFTLPYCAKAVSDNLDIHFLDVGMGDAILLVQTFDEQQHAMMIDTGDKGYSNFVYRYVESQGVTSLDFMVLTHPHADHIGGTYQLLNSMLVGALYMTNTEADTDVYRRVIGKAEECGTTEIYPQVGDTFTFGDATFTVYAPHPVLYYSANDWSLVLMMEYHGIRVLFIGDAEYESECDMLYDPTLDLHADVLKVGHHGSQTSTSYDFAQAVSPTYAIISCGESDTKEYPDIEVGMNLMDAGVETILSTMKDGTVVMRLTESIEILE